MPARNRIPITLDKVIPPIEPPKDTKYIKHIKIQSERLTKFWGRPMHLGAHVLLPEGFDAHPEARYPLVIFHGHFPADFGGFRETAARSKSEARLQRTLQTCRLQPHRSGARAPVLQRVDWSKLSALHDHRDPARESLLRRFLRGQLRQPWSIRRRDHLRAGSGDRETFSRHRQRLGALSLRRLDRRLGSDGRADLLSGRIQRRVDRVSRSDRFPRVHRRQHLRTRECLLRRFEVEDKCRVRASETISASCLRLSKT